MSKLPGNDWRLGSMHRAGSRGTIWAFGLLIATAGIALAGLFMLQPVQRSALVSLIIDQPPVSDTAVSSGRLPWFSRDTEAINKLGIIGLENGSTVNPSRDELRLTLANLTRYHQRDPVILHISGLVTLDPNGIYLEQGSQRGDHTGNRITMAEVARFVKDCPSHKKLIVLNLHESQSRDWVSACAKELDSVSDPHRLVLFATGPGQDSHAIDEMHQTAFGYYFAVGLGGAADGWNVSGSRDNRVSVRELASFVRTRVVRWSETNRTTPQVPWLMGDAGDFELSSVKTHPDHTFPERTAYPQSIVNAWKYRDKWISEVVQRKSMRAVLQLEQAILALEQQWLAGSSDEQLTSLFNSSMSRIELENAELLSPRLPAVIPTIAHRPIPEPAVVEALRAYLIRQENSPPPTPEKPAEKAPAITPEIALSVLRDDQTPRHAQVRLLSKLLFDIEPEPKQMEVLLIHQLAKLDAGEWNADYARRLIRLTLEFERIASNPREIPTISGVLEVLHRDYSSAWATVLAPGYVPTSQIESALSECEQRLAHVQTFLTAVDNARDALFLTRRLSVHDSLIVEADIELQKQFTLLPKQITENELASHASQLSGTTAKLRDRLSPHLSVLKPDSLNSLKNQTLASDANAETLTKLTQVLESTLISTEQRVELWNAKLTLSHRLCEQSIQRDSTDDRSIREGAVASKWRDPSDRPMTSNATNARILLSPIPESNNSPTLWTWQAKRFEWLISDPLALPDPAMGTTFAVRVANAIKVISQSSDSWPRLEIQAKPVVLTPAKPQDLVNATIRLIGGNSNRTVNVRAMTPNPLWLKPIDDTTVSLNSTQTADRKFPIVPGEKPQSVANARGVMIAAEYSGSTTYKRLPANLDALTNRLDLYYRYGVDGPLTLARELRVRPHGLKMPIEFTLNNSSIRTQTMIARLQPSGRETAPFTLPPGESNTLKFLPSTTPVAPLQPGVAPSEPMFEIDPSINIEILDPTSKEIRQVIPLTTRPLDPSEVIKITDAVFHPASFGKASELSVTLAPQEPFDGGPMSVELAFPKDRNRGFTVPDGKLRGQIQSGGAPLKLYVQNLKFGNPAGQDVVVTLNADGVSRTVTLQGLLVNSGSSSRLQVNEDTAVRGVIEEVVSGNTTVPVRAEVDRAGLGSFLKVEVGTVRWNEFELDYTHPKVTARTNKVILSFDAKNNPQIQAVSLDPEMILPALQIVGPRIVQFTLMDRSGNTIAWERRPVVFDGTPPQNLQFIDMPPRARRDQPLKVLAVCDPPVSGIKEVKFFLGKPVNNAPPPNTPVFPGKPMNERNLEFQASLPLGDGKDPIDVSVMFITRSGASSVISQLVERVDPADLDKQEPGTIRGTVLEGAIPQVGLTVTLLDAKGQPKAQTVTKDGGMFEMLEVPVGEYRLYVAKEITGREKSEAIKVKPAATTVVEMGLLLK